MKQAILQHLEALVSFDTQNPPRAIAVDSPIFSYLRQQLPGFECSLLDAGQGSICLLATRGKPDLLFNFHIDTVPVAPGWTKNPFKLDVDGDTVTALGACDIKGASACMLAAVNETDGDVALLFSSDEEHGTSAAIKYFLATKPDFKQVIVAEPTLAKAVSAHRGLVSGKVKFSGISGHGSEKRALTDSAIHKAGRWMNSALEWVENLDCKFDVLEGLPFNIGKISGGIKGNMIAGDCELAINYRPLPGQCGLCLQDKLQDMGKDELELNIGFSGPALPAANQPFEAAVAKAGQLVADYNLPKGDAVNFWTEASLFSQAGMTAVVYGPGDIAQAHTADEWVSAEQLTTVAEKYCEILAAQKGQPSSANEKGQPSSASKKGQPCTVTEETCDV